MTEDNEKLFDKLDDKLTLMWLSLVTVIILMSGSLAVHLVVIN